MDTVIRRSAKYSASHKIDTQSGLSLSGTVYDLSRICEYRILIQTIRQEWAEIMTKFGNQHPHSIESAHAHLSFKTLAM